MSFYSTNATNNVLFSRRKLKKDGIPHTLVDWILHLLMEQWESSGVSEDGGNTDFYEDFVKKCKVELLLHMCYHR